MPMKDMKDLALFFNPNAQGARVTLYEPVQMKKAISQENWAKMKAAITGFLNVRWQRSHGAYQPVSIAAKHGYGAILHYIFMEMGADGLSYMPEPRANKITEEAKNFWAQLYDGKGSAYVQKEEIVQSTHEEVFLSYSYQLTRPTPVANEIDAAIQRHQNIFSDIRPDMEKAIWPPKFKNEEAYKSLPLPDDETRSITLLSRVSAQFAYDVMCGNYLNENNDDRNKQENTLALTG